MALRVASATISELFFFEKAIPKGLPFVFACTLTSFLDTTNISPVEAEET